MRKQASPGPEEQEAYDEALRRVEKCRQKGKDGTKLDLNFLGLTTLPEALWKLTALRLLDLQNNQFTTLPEVLGQLTALQMLFLHGNPALGLPDEILGPMLCHSNVLHPYTKARDILDYYFAQKDGPGVR